MNLDRFIKQDITEFLENEQEKDIQIKGIRDDEVNLFDIDRDYVKELKKLLMASNSLAAKDIFSEVINIYNSILPNDPLRKKVFEILKEMFRELIVYAEKHELTDALGQDVKFYKKNGIFNQKVPPTSIPLRPRADDVQKTSDLSEESSLLRDEAVEDKEAKQKRFIKDIASEIAREVPLEETKELGKIFAAAKSQMAQPVINANVYTAPQQQQAQNPSPQSTPSSTPTSAPAQSAPVPAQASTPGFTAQAPPTQPVSSAQAPSTPQAPATGTSGQQPAQASSSPAGSSSSSPPSSSSKSLNVSGPSMPSAPSVSVVPIPVPVGSGQQKQQAAPPQKEEHTHLSDEDIERIARVSERHHQHRRRSRHKHHHADEQDEVDDADDDGSEQESSHERHARKRDYDPKQVTKTIVQKERVIEKVPVQIVAQAAKDDAKQEDTSVKKDEIKVAKQETSTNREDRPEHVDAPKKDEKEKKESPDVKHPVKDKDDGDDEKSMLPTAQKVQENIEERLKEHRIMKAQLKAESDINDKLKALHGHGGTDLDAQYDKKLKILNQILKDKKDIAEALKNGDVETAKQKYYHIRDMFRKYPHSDEKVRIYKEILAVYARIKEQMMSSSKDQSIEQLNHHLKMIQVAMDHADHPRAKEHIDRSHGLVDALPKHYNPEPYLQRLKDFTRRLSGHADAQTGSKTESITPIGGEQDVQTLYMSGLEKLYGHDNAAAARIFSKILQLRPSHVAAKIRLREAEEAMHDADQ